MENLYCNITTETTTTVCSRPCILAGIIINSALAGGAIEVYDGDASTGTAVATIISPPILAATNPLISQVPIDYHDICLKKSLTIVTTLTQDITVAFRPTA